MMRRDVFGLAAAITVTLPLLWLPADLPACQCIDRGPTCSWFTESDGPVFTGRVVASVPGPWAEFEARSTVLANSLGLSDPDDLDPESLDPNALRAFISMLRDYLGGALDSEADRALAAVVSADDLQTWHEEFGDALDRRIVQFQVTEVLSGAVGQTFELHTGLGSPGDCSPEFKIGEDYLVFADGQDGDWSTNTCSGTRLTEFARADLEYLRSYRSSTDTVRISGTFYRHEFDRGTRRYSTEPIGGIDVIVQRDDRVWKTTTQPDGLFEVADLTPGRYQVSGDYPGWEVIESGSWRTRTLNPTPISVDVNAGSCGFVELTAYRARGAISGRLLDQQKQPLKAVGVEAVSVGGEYLSTTALSDELGRFQFDRLELGTYLVGVNIESPPRPSTAYGTKYYPGVEDRDHALPVIVEANRTVDIGDVQAGALLKLRRIRGRVVGVDDAIEKVWVELRQRGHGSSLVDIASLDAQKGSFVLSGLEGFEYDVAAMYEDHESGHRSEVSAEVSLDANQEIVISLSPQQVEEDLQ